MFYRLRVYWRYSRRRITEFNALVRDASWGPVLESHFWLAFIALVLLYTPFYVAQQLFERVIWIAVHKAMGIWLAMVPLSLMYTCAVKLWRRR